MLHHKRSILIWRIKMLFFYSPISAMLFLCTVLVAHAHLVVLKNGGKTKCKEIIHQESSIICNFDESQIIIKLSMIQEIIINDQQELYQNSSTSEAPATESMSYNTYSSGDDDEEIKVLEQNYQKYKNNRAKYALASAYSERANELYLSKKFQKALDYILKLDTLIPNDSIIKLKVAYCYYLLSDLFMSQLYAQTSKKLDKSQANAYFLLDDI